MRRVPRWCWSFIYGLVCTHLLRCSDEPISSIGTPFALRHVLKHSVLQAECWILVSFGWATCSVPRWISRTRGSLRRRGTQTCEVMTRARQARNPINLRCLDSHEIRHLRLTRARYFLGYITETCMLYLHNYENICNKDMGNGESLPNTAKRGWFQVSRLSLCPYGTLSAVYARLHL